jgi:hypothetical protein
MGVGNALLAIMAITFLLSALLHAFLKRRRLWLLVVLILLPTLTFIAIEASTVSDERFHILLLLLLGTGCIATTAGVVAGFGLQALQRALKLR